MVKKISLSVILLTLAACSSLQSAGLEYNYPNQKKFARNNLSVKKSVEQASISAAIKTDAVIDDKIVEEIKSSFNWPIKNAEKYLSDYKQGQIANAKSATTGLDANFSMLSEYTSAKGEACKKYLVDNASYIACYGSFWYPVRSFEE